MEKSIRHINSKLQMDNKKLFEFDSNKYVIETELNDGDDNNNNKYKTEYYQNYIDNSDVIKTGNDVCDGNGGGGDDDVLYDGIHCSWHNDTVLCWPKTLGGTTAYLPCFEEFNGIKYDSSRELNI